MFGEFLFLVGVPLIIYVWCKLKTPKIKYLMEETDLGITIRLFFNKYSATEFGQMLYKSPPNKPPLYSRFGINGAFNFWKPQHLIRNPEIIRKIAIKDFDHFEDHRGFTDEKADELWGNSLFALKGKKWRQMRATLSPAFTGSKMRQMFPMNDFYTNGKIMMDFTSLKSMIRMLLLNKLPVVARVLGITLSDQSITNSFRHTILDTLEVRKKNNILRPDMINIMMQIREGIEETEAILDGKRISFDALQKMKFMDQVISETLRKWPPAVQSDRVCVKEYMYDDGGKHKFKIEKGTPILFPTYYLHHDAKYFPEPEKFDPERFNDDNKGNIIPGTSASDHGIASRFALMEIKAIFYYLLLNFSIEPNQKTEIPMKLKKSAFTLHPENGLHLSTMSHIFKCEGKWLNNLLAIISFTISLFELTKDIFPFELGVVSLLCTGSIMRKFFSK